MSHDQLMKTAKKYSLGTYIKDFVAPDFQKMIRAEFGSCSTGTFPAVVNGNIQDVHRYQGQVVCVTCGNVGPWASGLGGMHTGHFLSSRRWSILFEEENVAPQCSRCNRYENGAPQRFRLWMEHARGLEAIERLERLKNTTRSFTRDELVDMRLGFMARLKAAKERIR